MANQASSALGEIKAELLGIVDQAKVHSNYQRLQNDFGRWKRRAVARIASDVSHAEAMRFSMLREEPSWVGMETFDVILNAHATFLDSLFGDVAARPEDYGPSVAAAQRKAEEKAARRHSRQAGRPASAWIGGKITDHPVISYLIIIGTAFSAGLGAQEVFRRSNGMELISRHTLDSLHSAATAARVHSGPPLPVLQPIASPSMTQPGQDVRTPPPGYDFRAAWRGYADSLAAFYQQSPPQCDATSQQMRARARARLAEIEFEARAAGDTAQIERIRLERMQQPITVGNCR